MAKELPYFRFTPSEWQNGNISLESLELKGLFIDVCSYYWIQDCSITIAMLEKRFRNDKELLKDLLDLDIMKVDEETEYIHILFLDEQFDILSEARKRRQKAGSDGGKAKASNAKAKLKQCSSYKDKDKDKDKDNILFDVFWESYNKKVGSKKSCEKKWNALKEETKKLILETLPLFVSQFSNKQFQPFPETYLNQERWNDELQNKPKSTIFIKSILTEEDKKY